MASWLELVAGAARAHGAVLVTDNLDDFPMRDIQVEALWSELLDGHLRGLTPDAVASLCGGLVDDLAGFLRTAAAIHGSWRDDVAPAQLRGALAALLTNLSRQGPVLAVLDDIQLADASSWEALGYLAHDR